MSPESKRETKRKRDERVKPTHPLPFSPSFSPSVDVWAVSELPVKVTADIDPILGTVVGVGALVEPPE